MAVISKQEVLKIAHMSRIAIHEDEIDALTQHLEAVLAYASRVNQVVTDQSIALPYNRNVFREDEVIPFDAASIKQEAPNKRP